MSAQNLDADLRVDPGELEDSQFDEEAARARSRQYLYVAATIAAVIVAILAIPWRDHVKASGRIAPQRWARVHAEAPGVVREVTHAIGETMEEGEVIAVLDFDEQRDALEAAQLALPRERQKLADLELRQRENDIQREGAEAVAKSAGERAIGAQSIDESRLAALDPYADATLRGVRNFTAGVRAELARSRSAPLLAEFKGDEIYRGVREAMTHYTDRAARLTDQLVKIAGTDAGRQFNFQLEDLRFAYDLTDHSMEELLMKYQLVQQGFLAPVALRAPCVELEREAMELTRSFRGLTASARTVLGTPAEQTERVRGAEEQRRLLASESERIETERASVASEIAAAELAVRSAERHQGKTVIRAPIRGKLAGESISRFDAVSANASVGVVEDASRLVLKVQVDGSEYGRIKLGQAADFGVPGGGTLHGSVIWKTPQPGQAVRDQAWNVLIQLRDEKNAFELGDKVMVSIDVGRRSLLGRWFEPASESAAAPRVAFVEDPTELRKPAGAMPESVAAVREQVSQRPTVSTGTDGG